jgi:predicted dienelactone hydrolase
MSTERLRLSKGTIKGVVLAICVLVLIGAAFVAVLAGYVAGSRRQPLILPSPTGSYAVGRMEYDWTDPSRTDPFSSRPNEKRELVVWAWYPASTGGHGPTAPYLPPTWEAARERDQGIGQFVEHDFDVIVTHSSEDAPLAGAEGRYPVLIMQPGMGPVPTDYTVLVENLASHGYIVFGINPTYTSNVIALPDGRVALRMANATIPDGADAAAADQDANPIGQVWADDAIFVLDMLEGMAADPSSRFYARLDLAHVGLFGHSFGGATAVRVCELDERCQAGADLDGTLFSDTAKGTLQKPFLFMTETKCGSACETMRQMFSKAGAPAYYLSLDGAEHFSFSDLPLRLLPPVRTLFVATGTLGPIRPARGLEIASAYLVAFFDRYLQGIDSALLLGPSPEYPEVEFDARQGSVRYEYIRQDESAGGGHRTQAVCAPQG